jgi:hypothetical protein
MALVIDDRIRETTTVTGTNDATLLGAVTGFQAFSVLGNGNTTYYTISDQAGGNWECGIGTFSSVGPTLARTTVLSSSAGGAKVSFPAGTKDVFVTYPSDKAVYLDESGNVQPALGNVVASQVNITAQGDLRLEDTTGGQYVALQAPGTVASSYTLTLPVDDGTNGQALITDGSGNLSWSSAASGDVYGPASATDDAIARFDGTTGKIIQNSSALIDDAGNVLAGAGLVSAPAFSTTGDTNTGIFFPAADTIAFTEGGVESMRIDSNGDLGLGTTTILGADPNRTVFTIGATTDAFVNFGTGSTRWGGIYASGTKTTLFSDTFLSMDSGGSERMRIDSSGNVLINKTAADDTTAGFRFSTLNYFSIARSGASPLYLNRLSNDGTSVQFAKDGTTAGVIGTASGGMFFGTGSFEAERMRIDSSGNVGIGTSSPTQLLTVAGNGRFTSGSGNRYVVVESGATSSLQLATDGTASYVYGVGAVPLIFATNSAERMRIDSAGLVAIGTSTPAGRVTIAAPAATTNDLVLNGSTTSGAWTQYANTGGSFYVGLDSSAGANFGAAYSANLYHGGAYPMIFWTTGLERMRIDSSGRVGIGTSSPAYRLDVNGSLVANGSEEVMRIAGADSTQSGGINIKSVYGDSASDRITTILSVDGQGQDSPLAFGTGTTERMRINSIGNLGLGTTSPSSISANYTTLDIRGSAGGGMYMGIASGTNTLFYTDSGGSNIFTSAAIPLQFGTNNAERMRIDSSGLVGIGTSSPTNTLQVAGGISATSASPAFQASAAIIDFSGAIARFTATGADNSTNGTMSFNTANANASGFNERMRITSLGNVLIGTTSSTDTASVGARLFPSGSIKSTLAESTGAGSTFDAYSTGAGAYRFYVDMAGTVFATNTTISAISDARLKENIEDIDVGLDAVMALKPRKFDWKTGKGKNIKGDRGWIAQEFETVFPEMINEWKDKAPEGEESYKSVAADLIPVLVKAIQEQQTLINNLTTRLNALEGK